MSPCASVNASAVAVILLTFCNIVVGAATTAGTEEDTTVLLQGELVRAKSSEQAKKHQVEIDTKSTDTVSPACTALAKDADVVCQLCGEGEPTEESRTSGEELSGFLSEKMESDSSAVIGLAEVPNDSPKANAEAPAVILRNVLKLLIFLLFVDGLRRWFQEGTFSSKTKETAVPLGTDYMDDGRTPAQKNAADAFAGAALLGDAIAGQALLEDVTAVDGVDVWGSSLLHAAAKGGSARLVNLLLHQGAKVDPLDAWDETPLHLAARGGFTEACELLLDAGAAIEMRNMQDRAALEIAAAEGKTDVCEVLLARGATVPKQPCLPFIQELLREGNIGQSAAACCQSEPLMDQDEEDIRFYGRDGFEVDSFGRDGLE